MLENVAKEQTLNKVNAAVSVTNALPKENRLSQDRAIEHYDLIV